MKVSNYFPAYTKIKGKLKPTYPGSWTGKSGVYLIKKMGDTRPLYIGSSIQNLKRTIYRHFQQWSSDREKRFERTVYPKSGYLIKIISTTPGQALELEKYLIKRLQPRDNPIKYNQLILSLKEEQKQKEKIQQADKVEITYDEKAPF